MRLGEVLQYLVNSISEILMAERGDTTDSISLLRPHHVSLVLPLGLSGLSLSRGGPLQGSLVQ